MVCDPEKLLNIRNNILVLIHAKYCPKDPSECNQSHCIEFKELQEHMKNCHDPDGICDVKYCVQSRQYIRHMNKCEIEDCELCAPLKGKYYHHAYENAKNNARDLLAKLKRKEKLAKVASKFESRVDLVPAKPAEKDIHWC